MSIAAAFERAQIELIRTLGGDVTLTRDPANSVYDPNTGTTYETDDILAWQDAALILWEDGDEIAWEDYTDTTTETIRVAFGRYAETEVDGTSIQRGDRKAYIATERNGTAITKTPKPGDLLVGKGQTVRIIDVRRIEIGDTVAAYVAQVRE